MKQMLLKLLLTTFALSVPPALIMSAEPTDPDKFKEAIRLDPKNAKIYIDRGIAYFRRHELDRAIGDFNQAIELDPTIASAYEWRGATYLKKGDSNEGIKDFGRAIELDPTNVIVRINRANVYRGKGEFQKAIADLNICIRLRPEDANVLAVRGECLNRTGQFEMAIRDYQEAIRLIPKHAQANNGLAWVRATCPVAQLRDANEAVKYATKACELTNWTMWQCIDTLAAAFAEAGNFESAVMYQKKAMEMNDVSGSNRDDMQHRLTLYQQHKPYHNEK